MRSAVIGGRKCLTKYKQRARALVLCAGYCPPSPRGGGPWTGLKSYPVEQGVERQMTKVIALPPSKDPAPRSKVPLLARVTVTSVGFVRTWSCQSNPAERTNAFFYSGRDVWLDQGSDGGLSLDHGARSGLCLPSAKLKSWSSTMRSQPSLSTRLISAVTLSISAGVHS